MTVRANETTIRTLTWRPEWWWGGSVLRCPSARRPAGRPAHSHTSRSPPRRWRWRRCRARWWSRASRWRTAPCSGPWFCCSGPTPPPPPRRRPGQDCNVMTAPKWELKKKMPFQSKEEPEPWRMSLLTTFVSARINKTYSDLNLTCKQLNAMIDSLCSS